MDSFLKFNSWLTSFYEMEPYIYFCIISSIIRYSFYFINTYTSPSIFDSLEDIKVSLAF